MRHLLKIGLFFVFALGFLSASHAQSPGGKSVMPTAKPQAEFPIYAGTPPDGHGGTDAVKDIPTLTPFWPAPGKATGAAMVVLPGGGYGALAVYEGKDYALWLAERGIASFVLKYRLGSAGYHHPAMLHDVQRAMRVVRSHAADWQINAARVGVMGSSAGGHLASTALTHYDAGNPTATDTVERVSSRPDVGVLCYAVITMDASTHAGSRNNLLGPNPSPDLVTFLSSEKQVTKDTPPCFIWHTRDDSVVKVENALLFSTALAQNNVPFALHVYEHGPHGLGLGPRGYEPGVSDATKLLPWTRELEAWLKTQQFIR